MATTYTGLVQEPQKTINYSDGSHVQCGKVRWPCKRYKVRWPRTGGNVLGTIPVTEYGDHLHSAKCVCHVQKAESGDRVKEA